MDNMASSGQGRGNKAHQGQALGRKVPVASVPCAWHHSSQKMWDLSTSGSPAGHAGWYQRKGDILPPVHIDAAIRCFCEVGITLQDSDVEMSLSPASRTNLGI